MATDTTLQARVTMHEAAAFASLARRCGTSQRLLGEQAIKRMLLAAKGGIMPEVPMLEPDQAGCGIKLWLQPSDAAALHELADNASNCPVALAGAAVRHMLAQAQGGAMPMMKPLQASPEPALLSWEVLAKGRADFGGEQDYANYGKALYAVERTLRLVDEGLNKADPAAALREIDEVMKTRPHRPD